jgi:hypothetical protein
VLKFAAGDGLAAAKQLSHLFFLKHVQVSYSTFAERIVMAYIRPKATYFAFPAAAIPEVGKSMLERWAEQHEWWQTLPFGWLTVVIVAFGVGVVIQDLVNEKSALRHNWREWRRIFDVLTVHASHVEKDNKERVDIFCRLKFRKTIDEALLTVRVIVPLPYREADVKLIHREKVSVAAEGEKTLRLGNIAIATAGQDFTCHSVWGDAIGGRDIAPGQYPIYASRNIIEISIASQTYQIYAHVLDVSRKEHAYVYLLTENDLPEFSN